MVGFQQSLRCFLLLMRAAAVLAGINIISHAMIFIRRLQHALAVLQFF